MSFINQVVEFCKVVHSAIVGPSSATAYNLTGIAGFAVDAAGRIVDADESDDAAEQAHEQEVYQSLGVIGRPLPPDPDAFAEALTIRTEDGLVPFAFRDLRLHRAINAGGSSAPSAGQLMFAGYGGAFLSHAMTAGGANVTTLYVPYDFDANGAPQKAHAITLDPTAGNRSISVVHGSGVFFALTEDAGAGAPGITWAIDGATFGRMAPGEFLVNAAKITLRGNVYLGRTPEAGAPLLGGPISPPSASVFISPA